MTERLYIANSKMPIVESYHQVTVEAPARIHMSLLNESGYLGRIDGSIGLHIRDPSWKITVTNRKNLSKFDHLELELQNALKIVIDTFCRKYAIEFSVLVFGFIPLHAGMGAKTSLLLGTARAINDLFGLDLKMFDLSVLIGRGSASGIGYWAASKTGFIWEAGRTRLKKPSFSPSSSFKTTPPNLICNIDLKEFYICHFRFSNQGIFGDEERSIFEKYCPFPLKEAEKALLLVSGGIVPCLLEKDFSNLQIHLKSLQNIGLKKIEWLYQDKETKEFRDYWDKRSSEIALCLSSMGSTLYCITDNPEPIHDLISNYHMAPKHFMTIKH